MKFGQIATFREIRLFNEFFLDSVKLRDLMKFAHLTIFSEIQLIIRDFAPILNRNNNNSK